MLICSTCRKEMQCVKNGVAVVFGESHAYSGDRYECATCGANVVDTNQNPWEIHPEYRIALEKNGRLLEMLG